MKIYLDKYKALENSVCRTHDASSLLAFSFVLIFNLINFDFTMRNVILGGCNGKIFCAALDFYHEKLDFFNFNGK